MSVVLAPPPSLGTTIRFGLKDVSHVMCAEIEPLVAISPKNVAGSKPSEGVVELSQPPSLHERESPDITSFDLTATHLISSPYIDVANHLRLRQLDTVSRMLAFALTLLKPTRSDYATAPYLAAFNWPVVFQALRKLCQLQKVQWQQQEFYLVIFRSQRQRNIDVVRLTELDQRSHEEACASGGLLKYWFGSCDADMKNLATCIWRNREDAAAGGNGPWHRKARSAARELYESISFETYRFIIGDSAETWRLEEYMD